MKNIIWIGFLLTFHFSASSYAQRQPPGLTDMTFFKHLEDLFEAQAESSIGKSSKESIQKITTMTTEIYNSLQWIGNAGAFQERGGFLIDVRAYMEPSTRRFVLLEPSFLGIGRYPIDALVYSATRPTIRANEPQNLIFTPEKSFFIWVTTKSRWLRSPRLDYGHIAGASSEQLRMARFAYTANEDLKKNLLVSREGFILKNLLNRLEQNIAEKSRLDRIKSQLKLLENHRNEAQRLNSQLNEDLRSIERANQVLKTIKDLQNILSVASLALQVRSAINYLSEDALSHASNPKDVVKVVEEYIQSSGGRIEMYRREFEISNGDLEKSKIETLRMFDELKVPKNVLDIVIK